MNLVRGARIIIFLGSALSMTVLQATAAYAGGGDSRSPYSNVIIFGDSQSDIGNGPESLTLEGDANAYDNIFTNSYVPISNPVNSQRDTILPGLQLDFPPQNNVQYSFKQTLPPQLALCDQNQGCLARQYRSINWASYFVYNAIKQGSMRSNADLRPWIIQYSQKTKGMLSQSVNYAWYSAQSDDNCVNFSGEEVDCDSKTSTMTTAQYLYAQQFRYRHNQSPTDASENMKLRSEVVIPNVQRQVALFAQDIADGKTAVNANTLYIVWTGANDIANAYQKDGMGADFSYQLLQVIPNLIAGNSSDSVVNRLLSLGAKHILVVGQYNLGLTPSFLDGTTDGVTKKHLTAAVINLLTTSYNQSLKAKIAKNFDTPNNKGKVHYVDIQTAINAREKNDLGYFLTIGQRCESDRSENLIALESGRAVKCYGNNQATTRNIGWWNSSHMATQMDQVIATVLLQAIKK